MTNSDGSYRTLPEAEAEAEAEARYRSIVRSSLDAIITIDGENRVTEFNPAAGEIFSYAREEVLGMDLATLIIPEEMREAHREGLRRHRHSATAPRLGRRIELEALRRDGTRFPIELTVSREGGSDTAQFTAFIRDLSLQRLAEARSSQLAEQLRASERLLTGVLSNLPGMAFRAGIDVASPLTFASDGCASLCGYSPAEFLAGNIRWSDLVRDEHRDTVATARLRASQGMRYECTYPIHARDGSEKWVLERGAPTIGGSESGIDGLIVDVTSEMVARQQLASLNGELESRVRQRTSELEAANTELETFSYSIAHDLRAPLISIAGFTRIIEEKVGESTELARLFQRVRRGIQHMDELTDAMLSLARIKRSARATDLVDLVAVAREVLERLQQTDPARQVRIDLPSSACVRGDKTLLRQVLENLIGNAWKFTGTRQCAHIGMSYTETTPSERTIVIEDNGVGFDSAGVRRLFKPFERLHARTEFEGTGVGLAVVHRIVAHHGGRIWAESELGRGAKFSFTLPGP